MQSIFKAIKKEILELLPAIIFFFLAFNLVVLTDALTTEQYGIRVFSFFAASVLALVMGKVVFLANILPWMNTFSAKPLIYNTIWKTFIYMLVSLLVRYLEHVIPLIVKYKNIVLANQHYFGDMIWPRYWAVQIWLFVILLIYAGFQELNSELGKSRLRKMFIGK